MNLITCGELKAKIDSNGDFKLVNALPEDKFKLMYIPGSINIFQHDMIDELLIPKDDIVVYCTDESCSHSIVLYQKLEEAGFEMIARFAGGLRRWEEDGHPLEGEMVR
ncbi:MAG: rhodanese-like domain-containing protein [Bacteroidetes bacterium]|nr:rhodanese-like domain-containing protein [Bacteroidota bacterium]